MVCFGMQVLVHLMLKQKIVLNTIYKSMYGKNKKTNDIMFPGLMHTEYK